MEQQHTTRKSSVAAHKKDAYDEGIGRRKTAVARVRLSARHGGKADQPDITVNGASFTKYFTVSEHHRTVTAPLEKTDMVEHMTVSAHVYGGGLAAQAEAIRLGIARALIKKNEELKKKLRLFGFITRDARVVERKKYGLKKARRAPQWSKR
ncbi:MAG: 30S ribosomal protein S9 [Candidatus Paceibacterota bacterium]|jgi:small subunit ribosomal protein S9